MKKILIAVLILVLSGTFALAQEGEAANVYDTPRDLPTRPIENEAGKKITVSKDFKGDFVVAIFWSRYCAPCLRELESLNNYQKIVKNDGIRVILISPDTEWNTVEEMKKMLKKYDGGDLEAYMDHNGEFASDLGIFTSPNTVLINKNGKEVGRIRGSAEWDSKGVIEYLYEVKAKHN